jgi:REP element-mobilizing transposase RayT
MPRRPRIKFAGIPQHIVQRGINREPCFFAEEDYHSYLHWLEKAAADWHCALHAYVLMTNHVHLLVTPETETGIAKLMQAVGRRYVQYINRSYKRTGSLWEGRYLYPSNLENLTLTGTTAINGTGNESANTIQGNSGANSLNGGAGNDTLRGDKK